MLETFLRHKYNNAPENLDFVTHKYNNAPGFCVADRDAIPGKLCTACRNVQYSYLWYSEQELALCNAATFLMV